MKRNITIVALFMLLAGTLARPARASAQGGTTGKLQPDEYAAVALIYNQELSALGVRALYPICVSLPTDASTKPLVEYLRKGGYVVSDLSVCQPNASAGGHPKDYPHGLRIFIDKPQRQSSGQLDMHVEATDLTLRPGEHVVATLRRGTYHFKLGDKGEWQVSGYTKEYDSKDEKEAGCKVAESAAPPIR
jgi:hypothetical protein